MEDRAARDPEVLAYMASTKQVRPVGGLPPSSKTRAPHAGLVVFSRGEPRPCRDCSAGAPTSVIAAGLLAAAWRRAPRHGPNFLFAPSRLSLRVRSEGEGDGYRWRRPRRQGFVAGSRAFRAPLLRGRLAVGGQGRGGDKPKAIEPSSCAQTRGADVTGHDPEIEELRDKVHCAVVLERTPPPWKLDRKESTRLSLKYRRGKGEILIVSHAGRGWWDPTSDAKGDVFGLVQRLEPGLTFGHVRKRLREFAGLPPCFPPVDREGGRNNPGRSVAERWAERKAVW